MKIAVVSGGFDPIHSGHLAYLNEARKYGDTLIVALNSDEWLAKKKGQPFMPFYERKIKLENLKCVDEVIAFEDDPQGSCIKALEKIKAKFKNSRIIFCNGGDRNKLNIPEMNVGGINFVFGVGGNEKANSSSWILKKWKGEFEKRKWGKFFNLYQNEKIKLKELIIEPGKGMSMQKHFKREEVWFVSHGQCKVNFSNKSPTIYQTLELRQDQTLTIRRGDWHQIFNPYEEECKIVEIQYGDETSEDDIERHSYYKGSD